MPPWHWQPWGGLRTALGLSAVWVARAVLGYSAEEREGPWHCRSRNAQPAAFSSQLITMQRLCETRAASASGALSQRASPRRFKFSSLETREARPAAQEQDRLLLQKTPLVSTQLPSPATGLGVRVT